MVGWKWLDIPNAMIGETQPAFTFSKLKIETLEKDVKYVQS